MPMPGRTSSRDTRLMKTTSLVAGTALVALAIGTCLLLGTVGWFSVGMGLMTECTNNYSCSPTSCAPCTTAGRWITAGGIGQLGLAALGAVALVRGLRARRAGSLLGAGAALLTVAGLTMVGTTSLARSSYCQPGTPGYDTSYCSVEAGRSILVE